MSRSRWAALLPVVVAQLAACGPGALPTGRGRPEQPSGWDEQVRLPSVTDTNPAPNVVAFDLDARVSSLTFLPGTTTPAWTYDGGVPGPLIRARVGDRVTVHFTNHLPEDTTVHWHGIRLTADMDGVPGHTQPPVHPGGSFDYSFVVPDAGLFWYHPHVASAKQVANGLYGALLVEDSKATDQAAATLGDELVLVLSDVDLAPDGSLGDPNAGGDFGTLFGRQGNTLLVNGKVNPTILARAGLRQRWRLVNASNTRYYQIALDGQAFTLIGVDGGFLERPLAEQQRLVVIPGGRADVVVEPTGAPGTIAPVRWIPYDRGYGTTYMIPEQDVFSVKLTDDAPYAEETPLPAQLRTIAPLDTSTALPRSIKLTQSAKGAPFALSINGVPADQAEAMPAQVGTTEVWTIENTMEFDHPFHIHGFFFQPLEPTGASPASNRWLDTVNVPQKQTVRLAIQYDDRPGMWMFHCHILDHADAGMMGMILLSE